MKKIQRGRTTVYVGRKVLEPSAPRVARHTLHCRNGNAVMRWVKLGATAGVIVTRWPAKSNARLASGKVS